MSFDNMKISDLKSVFGNLTLSEIYNLVNTPTSKVFDTSELKKLLKTIENIQKNRIKTASKIPKSKENNTRIGTGTSGSNMSQHVLQPSAPPLPQLPQPSAPSLLAAAQSPTTYTEQEKRKNKEKLQRYCMHRPVNEGGVGYIDMKKAQKFARSLRDIKLDLSNKNVDEFCETLKENGLLSPDENQLGEWCKYPYSKNWVFGDLPFLRATDMALKTANVQIGKNDYDGLRKICEISGQGEKYENNFTGKQPWYEN